MAGLGPRAAVTLPAAAALVLLLSFLLLKKRRSRQNSECTAVVATTAVTKGESPGDSSHTEELPKAERAKILSPTPAAMRIKDEKPEVAEMQLRDRVKERSPPGNVTQHGPKPAPSGEASTNHKDECAVRESPKPVMDLPSDSEVPRLEPATKLSDDSVLPTACSPESPCRAEENVVTPCIKSPCTVLTVDISSGNDAATSVPGEEPSGAADCAHPLPAGLSSPNGSIDSLLCMSSPLSSATASPQARKSDDAVEGVGDRVATLSLEVEEIVVAHVASEVGAAAGDCSQRGVTKGSKCSDSQAPQGKGDAEGSEATVSVPPVDEASPDDKSGALTQALVFSDAHSEGSSDSGKGGSDIHGGFGGLAPENLPAVYEFELPRELCGRFIGQGGRNVAAIKARSNASIYVHQHPLSSKLKLCTIEGTQEEIRIALDMIRKKFPLGTYPAMTLTQVNAVPLHGVALPDTLQVGTWNRAWSQMAMCSTLALGQGFLKGPSNNIYASGFFVLFALLAVRQTRGTKTKPRNNTGIICAAQVCGGWFRALVVGTTEDGEECDIKFLDYGGYMRLATSLLRQIRSDFMMLPFQASECYLANVQPAEEDGVWSAEACATFEDLAQGQILQALIVGYAENGIPLVHLYRVQGVSNVFINRELVTRGVACWLEHTVASL
ncbi:unnamed protein product [Ixodes hexagonus]